MISRKTFIFLFSISIQLFIAQKYNIKQNTGKLSEYSSYKDENFTMENGYFGYKYQSAILEIKSAFICLFKFSLIEFGTFPFGIIWGNNL